MIKKTRALVEDYAWYFWCVVRLGCDLTPAEFRVSAGWQAFVATAQRLLEVL